MVEKEEVSGEKCGIPYILNKGYMLAWEISGNSESAVFREDSCGHSMQGKLKEVRVESRTAGGPSTGCPVTKGVEPGGCR